MGVTKRDALKLLVEAHAAATNSGLFNDISDDCGASISVDDVCNTVTLYDEFLCFCIDHLVNFGTIPREFEFQGVVYGDMWCWKTAETLGQTQYVREEP